MTGKSMPIEFHPICDQKKPELPKELDQWVRGSYERRLRPTVSGLIFDDQGNLFLTHSAKAAAKGGQNLSPPQGGVDQLEEGYESPQTAFFREMKEELGLGPEDLRIIGWATPYESNGRSRKGFKGKNYLTLVATFEGDLSTICPDPNEVAAVCWITQEQREATINEFCSESKARTLKAILDAMNQKFVLCLSPQEL